MKKIVAINTSPRKQWNTAQMVKKAAEGAQSAGAQVIYYDLYSQEKFTGCISCFGCKLPANLGKCVCRDGMTEILDEIRTADGVIIGTANYLGDVTAGCRALYERLVFQSLSYKKEQPNYNRHKIPVLFIMTSNADEKAYSMIGYDRMLGRYKSTLDNFVGETKIIIAGNTLQVNNYDMYNWTMFDPHTKMQSRETQFPQDLQKAFDMGTAMADGKW